MVAYAYNPSTLEAKAGSLWIWIYPRIQKQDLVSKKNMFIYYEGLREEGEGMCSMGLNFL